VGQALPFVDWFWICKCLFRKVLTTHDSKEPQLETDYRTGFPPRLSLFKGHQAGRIKVRLQIELFLCYKAVGVLSFYWSIYGSGGRWVPVRLGGIANPYLGGKKFRWGLQIAGGHRRWNFSSKTLWSTTVDCTVYSPAFPIHVIFTTGGRSSFLWSVLSKGAPMGPFSFFPGSVSKKKYWLQIGLRPFRFSIDFG